MKSFKMPVMSSWKYAGACVRLKGTLTYLYLPKGELNTVLSMEDSSKGMWWYPAHRSSVEKYFALSNLEKMSSTLGIGQVNVHVTLLSAL